jgi:hypothetical protein
MARSGDGDKIVNWSLVNENFQSYAKCLEVFDYCGKNLASSTTIDIQPLD